MKYSVTLKKEDGSQETRIVEADSRFKVYEDLHNEGAYVVSLTEKGGGNPLKSLNLTIGTGIKTEERINFAKNLSAMLFAGLALSRALSVMQRQSHNAAFKKLVNDLEEEVKKGTSFHEGLQKYPKVFTPLFVSMVKAGEESGNLAESLKIVARQMDRMYTLEKKVRGAMIYPAIILFAIVIIGVLMMIYVVPTLSSTFKSLGADLPLATRVIIGTSDYMSHHVGIVALVLVLFFGGLMLFVRSHIGKRIILFGALHMPVIGDLVRETFCARAARTLSSLLSSGVEMLSAITITEEVVGDNVFGKVINDAGVRVKRGEPLSSAFEEQSKLYPFFLTDMISVGEETGKVSEMLGQVAEYYETDVEERTKDLSTIIEPLLMLVIGGAVGVFAMAMITPIYSLSSKI